MPIYDVIVIGRGLIGSAVARHLAKDGVHVVLIGPGEPADHRTHTGVFGSHYDSGRIARILDPTPYYSHIAKLSIQRYRPLESQTGIQFYHEVGYLAVSNNTAYLADMEARAEEFYPQVEKIPHAALVERFPYFHFPDNVRALYQATEGGYINPRQNIAAQNKALEMHSGTVIDETVLELDTSGETVGAKIAQGWIHGHKVVLVTGAFANVGGLIPRKIDFSVEEHTVVLAEVNPVQLPLLDGLPSLSYRLGNDPMRFIYFLPPILYPDGKHYLKIGHSLGDLMPNDDEALTRWFQGSGDPQRIEWLTETLHSLLPKAKLNRLHTKSCVVTKSPTGKQFIDQFDDERIYSLLADNGLCAKSADELGNITASFVKYGQWQHDAYNKEQYKLVYE
jgi:glycine/D-amino acid oxidase-like deaminating enzyme